MAPKSSLTAGDEAIAGALRPLGMTEYEIRVYLAILRHPLSRIPEVARESGVPQPKVYATVKKLIERGLCESHLGPVNTYSALPPSGAFEPMLGELEQQQRSAREIVRELQKEHVAPGDALGAREGRIKLFQGKQATGRNLRFLLTSAERSVCVIARLPLIVTDDDELLAEALARGVRVRILVETPDDYDLDREPTFRRQLALGCESRRLPRVPMRMGIFDERIAMLPMYDGAGEPSADGFMMLEVRNEGLAGGLQEIFEGLWDDGLPLAVGRPRRGRR